VLHKNDNLVMGRKKAVENYIRLNKTITHPRIIGGIKDLANELALSDEEACYHAIREVAEKQNKKKLQNSLYGGLNK
jgi:hypothetical protein